MASITKFSDCFSGPNAFYNAADYETTIQNLNSSQRVHPVYETTIQNKALRVTKAIASVILFPWGIGRLLHRAASRHCLPASTMNRSDADECRVILASDDPNRVYKRICVKVDGMQIDGMIIGTKETLENGKWILPTLGNGQQYESCIGKDDDLPRLAAETGSNLLVFNYAGVGRSSGWASRRSAVKSYRAMLRFLEDEKGIGAKQIISYGHSLGGGVQSEALKRHKMVEGIKYAFIKSRTFSNMRRAGAGIAGAGLGAIIKIFGWNLGSPTSSMKLASPEIILQTANENEAISDGLISAKASMWYRLRSPKAKIAHPEQKAFLGVTETHNDTLLDSTRKRIVARLKIFGLSVNA